MTVFDIDKVGVPKDLSAYRRQEFWEHKYASGDRHDWLAFPASVLLPYLPLSNEPITTVLILGCGTSPMTQNLKSALKGCEVFAVDYAPSALRYTQPKSPSVHWSLMDIRRLALRPDQFDIVIEIMTLDALWCERGSPWNPSEEIVEGVKEAVREAHRVLRPGGTFLSLSLAQPHFRLCYYKGFCQWSSVCDPFSVSMFTFLYKMIK